MENITGKKIVLSYCNNSLRVYDHNDKVSIYPLDEQCFENASITFNDNGSITLEGDCWQFGINFHDEYPENIEYKVHPSYITKTMFRHKDIVRAGWHRKLENKHKKIILNKYMIIQK